jgi:hypothetical protein
MLNRAVVREFLTEEFNDSGMDVPQDIDMAALTETFCEYVEADYYDWLKDNFKSFFDGCPFDWGWVRQRLERASG